MANRSAGRPKATHPRDVRVTVRLTEEEVDKLYRSAKNGKTLSECVREALSNYLGKLGLYPHGLRDNERSRLQRNLRQARRARAYGSARARSGGRQEPRRSRGRSPSLDV
jgi:hypothetical protein